MDMRRFAIALVVATVTPVLVAAPVTACSLGGSWPGIEAAVADADVVFEGTVISAGGGSASIAVTHVFAGGVSEQINVATAPPSTCAVTIQAGEAIIAAVFDGYLRPTAVWWVLEDGSIGTLAPKPPVASADELRSVLSVLPDTATAAPMPVDRVGMALFTLAMLIGVSRTLSVTRARRWTSNRCRS
jgi:hypothetical protein